jgi:hypothetical protein
MSSKAKAAERRLRIQWAIRDGYVAGRRRLADRWLFNAYREWCEANDQIYIAISLKPNDTCDFLLNAEIPWRIGWSGGAPLKEPETDRVMALLGAAMRDPIVSRKAEAAGGSSHFYGGSFRCSAIFKVIGEIVEIARNAASRAKLQHILGDGLLAVMSGEPGAVLRPEQVN